MFKYQKIIVPIIPKPKFSKFNDPDRTITECIALANEQGQSGWRLFQIIPSEESYQIILEKETKD